MSAREERRREARELARRYAVPLSVAAKAIENVARGRATAEFSAEVDRLCGRRPLPTFPSLEVLLKR